MVNADASMSRVYEGITLKVDKTRLSASCRFSDAGTNYTAYFSHINMIFYFACNGKSNSYHCLYGPFSINAYNSQRFNRACYSARMSPTRVYQLSMERGVCTVGERQTTIEEPENSKYRFLLSLFILQNWQTTENDPENNRTQGIKLDLDNANKMEFANELNQQKRNLQNRGILSDSLEDPSTIIGSQVKRTHRPTVIHREEDVEANRNYPLVNFIDLATADLHLQNPNAALEFHLANDNPNQANTGQPPGPPQRGRGGSVGRGGVTGHNSGPIVGRRGTINDNTNHSNSEAE